jgi:colanic acid biosynthesis glycosyl transferase WcaI
MKFLLLNQTFWPDVMATGQYLSEVAVALVGQGHQVTVVTSRRAYDARSRLFPKAETWEGVRIVRVGSTGFGKHAKWSRALDFASFMFMCTLRTIFLPRPDAILALTSPPLISFLGAWVAMLRGTKFYYWVMDLNPDEAIAAGWLRADSVPAQVLDWMSRFSFCRAEKVIVLDRFMREKILAKGTAESKVVVLPPWSHDCQVRFDPEGRERFRQKYGMQGKFVVMYSGNHSPCHPLDTLLEAARRLAPRTEIVFCFVGGGSEFRRVQAVASTANIVCVPYQPLSALSASLSAADLHLVVMGNPFVGLVHPCKIYNILRIGAPVLYIGPSPGHVPEVFATVQVGVETRFTATENGDVDGVVGAILRAQVSSGTLKRNFASNGDFRFSKGALLPKLVELLTR